MTKAETIRIIKKIDALWIGKLRLESFEVVVEEWHEFFANVHVECVKDAIKAYSEKGSPFPPTAPEIMDFVVKEQAKAYPSPESFVHDVRTAVVHFGSHNAEDAKAFLGTDAWKAAISVAPWQAHCNKIEEAKLKSAWEYHVRQMIKKKMEDKTSG